LAKWCRFINKKTAEINFGQLSQDGANIQSIQGDLFGEYEFNGPSLSLHEVDLITPCQPSKMIGLWNNYHALAKQQNNSIPIEPLYFIKSSNSFLKPFGVIKLPKTTTGTVGRVIYEGELGIVVGKTAKEITVADAKDYILGYTCVNDVTALEILMKDDSFKQWTRAKSYDTFGPFGPWIETEVTYEGLIVKTFINGRERQSYPCSDMIFNPYQILSYLSFDMTLYAGDVIACGTSLGVLPIKEGQLIEVEIEGVGKLANTVGDVD
jgi:2-keto-4-pentenoate hydratase/2-oxohepta-3-ene-1,7-dioic acid hydratase in catechol pathway